MTRCNHDLNIRDLNIESHNHNIIPSVRRASDLNPTATQIKELLRTEVNPIGTQEVLICTHEVLIGTHEVLIGNHESE